MLCNETHSLQNTIIPKGGSKTINSYSVGIVGCQAKTAKEKKDCGTTKEQKVAAEIKAALAKFSEVERKLAEAL